MKRIVYTACLFGFLIHSSVTFAGPADMRRSRTDCIRALVILVEFPDVKHKVPRNQDGDRAIRELTVTCSR
jgi:hypothetical protein